MSTDLIALTEIIQQFKACAAKGCPNEGLHKLTVIYFNKVGWFCDKCTKELLNEGLVFENKIGVGTHQKNPTPAPTGQKAQQLATTRMDNHNGSSQYRIR